MRIAIGNNIRGYQVKMDLILFLQQSGHEAVDFGCENASTVDYPDVARRVGEAVGSGQCERGILIGGNGMGMCMAANKVQGVRAAVVYDAYSAHITRERHDCNLICLAAEVGDGKHITGIVRKFLETAFAGGRYARMLAKLIQMEHCDGQSGVPNVNAPPG